MTEEQDGKKAGRITAETAAVAATTATDPQSEETEHWVRYYAATVERPAWETVRKAIELFAAEDAAAGETAPPTRFAVDLGCGAGRDTRELLRNGWRVLAMDRQPEALRTLETTVAAVATEAANRDRLATVLADFEHFDVPACDLANASLCLPYLERPVFDAAWTRVLAALPVGGRFAAMVFGDRDEMAGEAGVTCLAPEIYRLLLEGFEIEHWSDTEEDKPTVEGGSHHYHLIQFVARKAS